MRVTLSCSGRGWWERERGVSCSSGLYIRASLSCHYLGILPVSSSRLFWWQREAVQRQQTPVNRPSSTIGRSFFDSGSSEGAMYARVHYYPREGRMGCELRGKYAVMRWKFVRKKGGCITGHWEKEEDGRREKSFRGGNG